MQELIDNIYEFNSRYPEELIRLKYELMEKNLFRFFRGTCHLFFENWSKVSAQIIAPRAWICGDLHLENFGSYRAANRMVYFDVNDFDEAVLAPATWEVVRTISSIYIAFEALGIEHKKSERMARQFLKSYSNTLAGGKPGFIDPRIANGIVGDFLKSAAKKKYKDLLEKKTGKSERISSINLDHPKHYEITKKDKKELMAAIQEWIRTHNESPYNYKVMDAVFRIAGTGSVGLMRYAFLLKSKNKKEKYLLIDMKEVRKSSVAPYLPQQPLFISEGERVVQSQRVMQNVPPTLFSNLCFRDKEFLIQEMQPTKDYIDFRLLKNRYRDMFRVIDDMGMLTASAQLRASGRNASATADELIQFGKDESWQEFIIDYAREQVPFYKQLYVQFYAQLKS
jgi:uncharacterized protein (DUF2252 family)